MAQFITPFNYQRLTDKWVVLTEDLVFKFTLAEVLGKRSSDLLRIMRATGMSAFSDMYVVAPKGFVTDLASVPERLHFIFKPDGEYAPAAVLHDMIYQSIKGDTMILADDVDTELLNVHHTRLFADRLFLKAMGACNVDRLSRHLIYTGVRLGGASSYGGEPMAETYGVSRVKGATVQPKPYAIFRKTNLIGISDDLAICTTKVYEWHKLKYPNLKRSFLLPTCLPG